MIYGFWNVRCDRQKFSGFWASFCPFSPLTTWKMKILTLKKTSGDIIILQICTRNDNHMIYGSWNMERNRHNFLSFWTVFCPLSTLWTQKIKTFKKKWKKYLTILSFYKDKRQSYDVWLLRYRDGMQWAECFVILDHLLPFNPLTMQKIKILKKWKKTSADIIILHMYTKNYDQIMYGSWDMVCDRCNYFSFWATFCSFTPLTSQKLLQISSFYICVPKIMSR